MSSSSIFPPDHGKLPKDEMNFPRQPGVVTLSLSGEKHDVANWGMQLMSWASHRASAVDFQISKDDYKIIIYPFAVND